MRNSITVELIDIDPHPIVTSDDETVEMQLRLNQASRYVLLEKISGKYRVEASGECTLKVKDKPQQLVKPNDPIQFEILDGEGLLLSLQCEDIPSLEEAYQSTDQV